MRVIRTTAQIMTACQRLRHGGRTLGFVPTMGALHEGHASLIRASASSYDATVVSIFVNPLQFGPREDFHRYPRTLAHDLRVARDAGAGIVFAPRIEQIYPQDFQTIVDVGPLGECWEGKSRPGHFRGVATVVTRLFQLVRPSHAVFGQKDYQQARIIQQVVRDLHLGIAVRILPTIREPDGLAMSSRNRYLTPGQRRAASALYRALRHGRLRLQDGVRGSGPILRQMRRMLQESPGVRIDYVALVDAGTLQPLSRARGRVALLVAAWVGRTRLIDNLLVDVS
jgi:pantoate--beta-alanine ligase